MHSNNTTVQNPKTGPASPKGSGAAGKARNPKKRAFSLPCISYNLHYTKHYKNQKQRSPFSCVPSSVQVLGASAVLVYHFVWDVWIACQAGIVKYSWTRPLSCERSFFTAVYPAAVFRSTRRLLHSKRAPLSYSLLRCQTVQRPLRWSQSTVLPEPPDSLHLPTR